MADMKNTQYSTSIVYEGEEYISVNIYAELLEITQKSTDIYSDIAKRNNIRFLCRAGANFYNLQDTERALKGAREFYSNYHTYQEISEKFNVDWRKQFKKSKRAPKAVIMVPPEYRKVLKKQLRVLDKELSEELIGRLGDSKYTFVYGKKFYWADYTYKLLEIGEGKKRQHAIKILKETWGLKQYQATSKYAYNAQQVDYIVLEVTKFYEEHLTALKIIEIYGEFIAQQITEFVPSCGMVPMQYRYVLVSQFKNIGEQKYYRKIDIEAFVEKLPKEEFRKEEYLSINQVKRKLNISNNKRVLEIMQAHNIRATVCNDTYYFDLEEINKLWDRCNEFYSAYYTQEFIEKEYARFLPLKAFDVAKKQVPEEIRGVLAKGEFVYEKEKIVNTLKSLLPEYLFKERVIEELDILKSDIQDAFTMIINEWNVRIEKIRIKDRMWNIYCLSDIDRMIQSVEDFYSENYTVDQIKSILPKVDLCIISKMVRVEEIPNKYLTVLRNKYNPKKSRLYARKQDIDSLIAKAQDNNWLQKHSIGLFSEGEYYYTSEDIARVCKLEDKTKDEIYCLCRLSNIKYTKVSTKVVKDDSVTRYVKVYLASQIDEILSKIQNILCEYYSSKQVDQLVPKSFYKEETKRMRIEGQIYTWIHAIYDDRSHYYYKKSDIDNYIEKHTIERSNILDNSYSKEDVMRLMNISVQGLRALIEAYEIVPIKVRTITETRYPKNVVEELIRKKETFFKRYITLKEIAQYLGKNSINEAVINKNILKRHPYPIYAKDKDNFAEYVYEREAVYKRIEEYRASPLGAVIKINEFHMDTSIETFYARLENYALWDEFTKDNIYTAKSWFRFVEAWLDRTKGNKNHVNMLINKLVKTTPMIKDMLVKNSKAESYMLTGKEVELYMRGIGKHQFAYIIELYLKEVAADEGIRYKGMIKYEDIPLADRIYPRKKQRKDDIYTFEEYQLVFNYCLDIKQHVTKGIEDWNGTGKMQYLSMWLYVIIHLNDSWRHGDIVEFPILNVEDILMEYQIKDINWFLNNEITLSMARRVFFRVHQWELTISKTQVVGVFWCSDIVLPAFATVVLMLQVVLKEDNICSEHLINFSTKDNRTNENLIGKFFNTDEFINFKFSSLKFNKTIMTYIYYIANLSGDPKSLLYVSRMREHLNEMTTIAHYIKINKNAIEGLSSQLLKRGEFGYITALLLKKLNGEQLNFEELTQQIEQVNDTFGDILKVNSTIAFMNTLRNERLEVFQKISSMSFEETQDLLTDIYLRKLPSKDSKDILCAYGRKKCVCPQKSCYDCMYHIPTIYALTSLYKALLNDIKSIENCKIPSKRISISISAERKKQTIREAISKFGKEAVYSCFECTRDEFLDEMAKIPSAEEIVKLLERE